jgi:integrase
MTRTILRLRTTSDREIASARRIFASLLTANKDVKVVQELLRHATPTMALGLYAQACSENARAAQSKIVEMVRKAPMPADFAGSQSVKAANVR